MQPLENAIKRTSDESECAALVIETILLGMRTIHCEMRSGRPSHLSVPQFRVLGFLTHHRGASLSQVADHMDLSLPSTSKAVDCLVRHGLVERAASTGDRRRIALMPTPVGGEAFRAVQEATRARVARLIVTFSPEQRSDMMRGLDILRSVLLSAADGPACGSRGR